MKIRCPSSTVVTACWFSFSLSLPPGITAWVRQVSSHTHTSRSVVQSSTSSISRCRSLPFKLESNRHFSALRMSTPTPLLEEQPSTIVPSLPVAEGIIVAQFAGGLSAVRVNDDVTTSNQPRSAIPSVVGVTPDFVNKDTLNSATSGDYLGKLVIFPNGTTGVVVVHRPPLVFCYAKEIHPVTDGMVQVMDRMVTLSASFDNQNVDCFGAPYSGIGTSSTSLNGVPSVTTDSLKARAIFAPIPKVANIALINNAMLSGNTMMDVLAPVGRGQNMLLIGADSMVLRGLAYDFLHTQRQSANTSTTRPKIQFVYASTDPDREAASRRLQEAGIADQVHFVGSSAATTATTATNKVSGDGDDVSRAAEAVLIASTACAIAESYALEKGLHTLVIIDDINSHKTLWDATTRVLVNVFGVDAVVKSDLDGGASSEMRGFYSSLIQRAGQFNQKLGGGSVTLLLLTSIPKVVDDNDNDATFQASDFSISSERIKDRIRVLEEKGIPLTAATLRKINIPIPTLSEGKRRLAMQHIDDLISMSDGQVWMDDALALTGQQPPIDPQRSITRIGIGADTQSRADAPAFRRIAEGIRLELSQAASMAGTETTVASQKQYRRQQAIMLAMHQPTGSGGRRLSESCVALLAVKLGYLDETVVEMSSVLEGTAVIQSLLAHVERTAGGIMDEVDECLDIQDEALDVLTGAVAAFFASYAKA